MDSSKNVSVLTGVGIFRNVAAGRVALLNRADESQLPIASMTVSWKKEHKRRGGQRAIIRYVKSNQKWRLHEVVLNGSLHRVNTRNKFSGEEFYIEGAEVPR